MGTSKKKVTAVVTNNERSIKFINQDIKSDGPVELRLRNDQAFVESEKGCIRIGIGIVTDKETGEKRNRLYAHAVDKREPAEMVTAVL